MLPSPESQPKSLSDLKVDSVSHLRLPLSLHNTTSSALHTTKSKSTRTTTACIASRTDLILAQLLAAAMGTLQSCRFISPAAAQAPFAAVRPPPRPSTSAFVPPGCRRWPSLKNQQRHGAIRPCLLVVRAKKHNYGGAMMPALDELADGHYFVDERMRVMDYYNDIIHIDHGCLYMEATNMSGQLCLLANQALTLASQIMSSASLNLGAPNEISISADTIHTTLRAYAKIFVDAADAAYGRRVGRNTATSLLGALRALASVSHILLDAALSQTHPRESLAEYALNCDVETMRCEFARQMDDIEHGVRKTSAAETWCKVVMPGIMEATRITGSLVRLMVARRERALGKANSKVVAV